MGKQHRLYRTNAFVPLSKTPAPRHARGSLLLGVAAVVVTSLLTTGSLGYAVYRLGAKHGAATAEKPAPARSAKTSPASPASPASPTAPFADDDVTLAPASPLASKKARPEWATEDLGVTPDAFAPQLSQPLDVFVRSEPFAGPLDRTFVICRFQTFNKHDTFAGDDLHVRAKLGDVPEVRANGPEDANLGFASAPLVTLRSGDKLRFEVYDRDVFSMPTITKATTVFAAPFSYVDEGAAVECRALTDKSLAETTKTYGAKADTAIAKVASNRVDPYSPEWSADRYVTAGAQRATEDVAALLGWADPRAQRRVTALDAAKRSLEGQRDQAFAMLHEAARDRVTFDRFDVTLGKVDCDDDRCTVRLSVTNHDRQDTLHFGAFASPFAYVADAHSRPITTGGGGDIPPGGTTQLVVTSEGARLTSGPSIVGICQGSRCAPLRVR